MKVSVDEYKQIAKCFSNSIERLKEKELRIPGDETKFIAENLADLLAWNNPRFDKNRFLTACGVQ